MHLLGGRFLASVARSAELKGDAKTAEACSSSATSSGTAVKVKAWRYFCLSFKHRNPINLSKCINLCDGLLKLLRLLDTIVFNLIREIKIFT
jgi:hypothetical protein